MYVSGESVCRCAQGRGKQSISVLVGGLFVTCAAFLTRERHMKGLRGREARMDEGIDTCKDG